MHKVMDIPDQSGQHVLSAMLVTIEPGNGGNPRGRLGCCWRSTAEFSVKVS